MNDEAMDDGIGIMSTSLSVVLGQAKRVKRFVSHNPM
jgi:hypothetical protein